MVLCTPAQANASCGPLSRTTVWCCLIPHSCQRTQHTTFPCSNRNVVVSVPCHETSSPSHVSVTPKSHHMTTTAVECLYHDCVRREIPSRWRFIGFEIPVESTAFFGNSSEAGLRCDIPSRAYLGALPSLSLHSEPWLLTPSLPLFDVNRGPRPQHPILHGQPLTPTRLGADDFLLANVL